MDKRFLAVVVAIIIIFAGFLLLRGGDSANSTETDAEPTNHIKGTNTTGVTLLEYGDFQCPACAAYYPIIEQVVADYSDRITFQFRHFPLISIHKNAFGASRAAEAAGKQDKFWEMYSKLFGNQQAWQDLNNPNEVFDTYAQQIGLDVDQYKSDFRSSSVSGAINADMKAGTEKDVSSTPTFFINGDLVQTPPVSIADQTFRQMLDAAIAAQESEPQN